MADGRRPDEYLFGYPDDFVPDPGNDDFYRWQRNCKPIKGLLWIEQRAKELQAEADAERDAEGKSGAVVNPVSHDSING